MYKSTLINVVAKTTHISKQSATQAVNVIFEEISRVLKKGNKVVISGFGTFTTSLRKEKTVQPFGDQTKKKIIKSHRAVVFKPSVPLKKSIW